MIATVAGIVPQAPRAEVRAMWALAPPLPALPPVAVTYMRVPAAGQLKLTEKLPLASVSTLLPTTAAVRSLDHNCTVAPTTACEPPWTVPVSKFAPTLPLDEEELPEDELEDAPLLDDELLEEAPLLLEEVLPPEEELLEVLPPEELLEVLPPEELLEVLAPELLDEAPLLLEEVLPPEEELLDEEVPTGAVPPPPPPPPPQAARDSVPNTVRVFSKLPIPGAFKVVLLGARWGWCWAPWAVLSPLGRVEPLRPGVRRG